MKTTYILIVAAAALLASHAQAQEAREAKQIAKAWLSRTCFDDSTNGTEDAVLFGKQREQIRAYFLAAAFRQLELNDMREEEAAFGRIYDENLKRLNENKPAWVTPEIEQSLRSIPRDVYVRNAKDALAESYRERALHGLNFLNSTRVR